MEDLLVSTAKVMIFAVLGIVMVYVVVRVATFAVLRSYIDFRKQLAKEEG